MSVGGISLPKHLGQSGHPIPDPVARTTEPARTVQYKSTKVTSAQRLREMSKGCVTGKETENDAEACLRGVRKFSPLEKAYGCNRNDGRQNVDPSIAVEKKGGWRNAIHSIQPPENQKTVFT